MIPTLSVPITSPTIVAKTSPGRTEAAAPATAPVKGFVAQYYELTLRVRLRGEKWIVVLLGPLGLVITHDANYASATDAEHVALVLAQNRLHQEKHDGRPLLETVDWQAA